MHFTAKTEIERVLDAVKANEVLVDETEGCGSKTVDAREPGPKEGDKTESRVETLHRIKCDARKKIRPELHHKTHFQAVLALVNRQSSVLFNAKTGKEEMTEEEAMLGTSPKQSLHLTQKSVPWTQKTHASFPQSPSGRSGSLPRLHIDPTSPLLFAHSKPDLPSPKGEEVSPVGKASLRGPQARTEPRWKGRRVVFALPNPMGATQTVDEHEKLGRKILRTCRVTREPIQDQLRRGEGHLMGSFGLTNSQVYKKIFGYGDDT